MLKLNCRGKQNKKRTVSKRRSERHRPQKFLQAGNVYK